MRARLASLLDRLPGRSGRPGPDTGEAGASSFARARELRTPWVRLLTAAGIKTSAEAMASNCEAGGKGEREAAELLAPLADEGWVLLFDRKLPRGGANIDCLAISPRGTVYNLDPKQWSARLRLTAHRGRLYHGNQDVTDRLDGIRYGTRSINALLSVDALPVALMLGPLERGVQLRAAGVRIIAAADACAVLRALDAQQIPCQRGPQFVNVAARLLPSYTRS